jgi:hypothetical protein
MIIYSLLLLVYQLLVALVSLIPTFEGVTNVFTYLPTILTKVMTFNYYLPVGEAITVVIACLFITLNYKAIKIVLNKFGIDISK